jgi:hypothetical protein
MKITSTANNNLVLIEQNGDSVYLDEKEQRYCIAWFWTNRPKLMREIICEECPKHIGEMEREATVYNECRRNGE